MIRLTLLTIAMAAMLLGGGSAASACPTGDYDAVGTNPAPAGVTGTTYRARVSIRSNGDNVCIVDWDLGGQRFSGIGFFDSARRTLNVAYANIADGWFGQISYEVGSGALDGKWTVYAPTASQIGTERLTLR